MNGYYAPLQTLLTLLTLSNRSNERANRVLREAYTEMTGEEVPANRNPWNEYLNATLEAQERERINVYLARPWDERLLVRLSRWLERLGWRMRHSREELDKRWEREAASQAQPAPSRFVEADLQRLTTPEGGARRIPQPRYIH